jgi:hypothetical protein
VDTDEKKNDRFMIDLSTKLQECMALNTGGTFTEFINTVHLESLTHGSVSLRLLSPTFIASALHHTTA